MKEAYFIVYLSFTRLTLLSHPPIPRSNNGSIGSRGRMDFIMPPELNQYNIQLFENIEKTLPRENIFSIIDSAPLDKAVCMVAPFGYGKTKAIASWLSGKDVACAFCSLSQTDNHKENFYNRLENETFPSIEADWQELRENPKSFTEKLTAIARSYKSKCVLVLDNLHYITEQVLLGFIKELIEALLGVCRVIILSRLELSPIFNDLILRGCIKLITAGELAFSKPEIEVFFKNEGYVLNRQIISEIAVNTEGWPAALNAVLAASLAENNCSYNETAKGYINNFFETHIWEDLPQNIRVFLIKTSILDTFSFSLCHAVSEDETTPKTLNWLSTHGLFVNSKNRKEYRYHPAFKEFLQEKLYESGIDINGLYIKAAWWMYENKKYKKAFQYFYTTKFFYGLDKMLKEFNPANLQIPDFLEMTECITELDPYSLTQYPNILAKMALVEFLKGNIGRTKELSEIFQSWVEPGYLSITPEEYAELYWEAGWLIYIDPDVRQLNNNRLADLANYKKYVPHLESLHIARCATLSFVSILRGIKDFSPITSVIEPFIAQADQNSQDWTNDHYTLLEMRAVSAEYYYETERFTDALNLVNKIIPLTVDQYNYHLYLVCITLFTKIMRAMNNTEGIDNLLEVLEKKIIEKNSFFLLPNFHAILQYNYLLDGNIGFIKAFLDENNQEIENNHYYMLYRKIIYSRVLLSLNREHQALIMLNSLELLCEKYKRVIDLIEVCNLKAIALYHLNDEINAVSSLQKSVETGEMYGYIRIFSDDAEELMPILRLLEKKMTSTYLKKVIISAKKNSSEDVKTVLKRHSHTELTKTELKILKSLQNNMSYNEISFEYGIKISTVRTHIQSIYGKLGVNNKTAAVLQAAEQSII